MGAFPLPVEIIPMARQPLSQHLTDLGAVVTLRQTADGEPFRSDENHWILDCAFGPTIADPPGLAQTLSSLPGVVEHGLFCGMTERVLLGSDDQVVTITN